MCTYGRQPHSVAYSAPDAAYCVAAAETFLGFFGVRASGARATILIEILRLRIGLSARAPAPASRHHRRRPRLLAFSRAGLHAHQRIKSGPPQFNLTRSFELTFAFPGRRFHSRSSRLFFNHLGDLGQIMGISGQNVVPNFQRPIYIRVSFSTISGISHANGRGGPGEWYISQKEGSKLTHQIEVVVQASSGLEKYVFRAEYSALLFSVEYFCRRCDLH
ncbi:hypothetical protein C8R44DRAFT_738396 [Mycena epipterygia]|nr:hypothetical protein C8R44DRAFT_738396 [Mycena epipterygia]